MYEKLTKCLNFTLYLSEKNIFPIYLRGTKCPVASLSPAPMIYFKRSVRAERRIVIHPLRREYVDVVSQVRRCVSLCDRIPTGETGTVNVI